MGDGAVTDTVERRVDAEDWERFQSLDRLTDHWWWRPGWRPGRRYLTWYVVFDETSPVVALARRMQAALDVPYLDPVPADGFHLTVQGVGFADAVDADEVRALGERARERCTRLEPFPVEVGPVAGYRGGVFLRVTPWRPLQLLRARLRDAIGRPVPDEPAVFKPHVSIAYCNTETPAGDLVDQVRRLRDLPPISETVDSIRLLRLRRDDHAYRWDVERTVTLGPPANRE